MPALSCHSIAFLVYLSVYSYCCLSLKTFLDQSALAFLNSLVWGNDPIWVVGNECNWGCFFLLSLYGSCLSKSLGLRVFSKSELSLKGAFSTVDLLATFTTSFNFWIEKLKKFFCSDVSLVSCSND